MSISSGSRLGPYEIIESIGAGGMGEVWRAKDTRLDREVAIKILPTAFAQNEQFLQRFEREARTISSLNHPHICTLHDVGHDSGTHYLVLELIEGDSLADRLMRSPLPLHDVLKYGRQIASALDAAHKRGVIHRDLKPGNIMITKSGAKLLDFGLAKPAAKSSPIEGLTSMPTAAKPLTREGTILGTFQYMAPEQLEGLEADARTDIFAFGAVLYEMATRRQAFQGETKTSLIAAIVSQQPRPISEVMPMTPPALDHVVRRCLEKDPDERWQSAHDIASQLQWISESGSAAVTHAAASRGWRSRLGLLAIALTAAVALGLAAGWIIAGPRNAAPAAGPSIRASIALAEGTQLAGWGSPSLAISPDGSVIAYVANRGFIQALYLRRIDEPDSRLVAGSDGAEGPFFSPDGQWVGFGAGAISGRSTEERLLKRVSVSGGASQAVCGIGDYFGGTWGTDGFIYFVGMAGEGLMRVRVEGGTAERVKLTDNDRASFVWPQFVPGAGILAVQEDAGNAVVFIDPEKGTISPTSARGVFARVVGDDVLVYTHRDGSMLAVLIDLATGKPKGSPIPIFSEIALTTQAVPAFAVSDSGTAVWVDGYVRGSGRELRRLVHLDMKGRIVPLDFEPDAFRTADLSPDGRHVVIDSWRSDLWIYDLERKTRSRLSTAGSWASGPIWSPDGASIVYRSTEPGVQPMMIQPVSGAGSAQQLVQGERGEYWPGSFTPDGRSLVYYTFGTRPDQDDWEIWIKPMDDPGPGRKLANGFAPRVSPTGRWMAMESDDSGSWEVQLQSFPEPDTKLVVSRGGGRSAAWSRDGRRLYYWAGESLMAVEVNGPSRSDVGIPVKLFDAPELDVQATRRTGRLMPTTDGFLVLPPVPGSGIQTQLNLATNWSEEVKRRIAGR
jgi:eukaryotic-like serine/threonine-protein kinase